MSQTTARKLFDAVLVVLGLAAIITLLILPFPKSTPAQSTGNASPVAPIQGGAPLNSETTSTAATAQTVTIQSSNPQGKAVLYEAKARCSAGTAQLTVADGGTQIWSSPAAGVGTTDTTFQWQTGLMSASKTLTVTVGTCGVSNTSVLDVQASIF